MRIIALPLCVAPDPGFGMVCMCVSQCVCVYVSVVPVVLLNFAYSITNFIYQQVCCVGYSLTVSGYHALLCIHMIK